MSRMRQTEQQKKGKQLPSTYKVPEKKSAPKGMKGK